MKPDIKALRLNFLIREYRRFEPSLSIGKIVVLHSLKMDASRSLLDTELSKILRFYSIIALGVLSEYIPVSLNPMLSQEITEILSHSLVNDNYIKNGKNYLVDLLIQLHTSKEELNSGMDDNVHLFEEFLQLERVLKEDSSGNYNLFGSLLMDEAPTLHQQLEQIEIGFLSGHFVESLYCNNASDIRLKKTVFEFFEQQNFFSEFSDLLLKTRSALLQSCFWYYYKNVFKLLSDKAELVERFFDVLLGIPLYLSFDDYRSLVHGDHANRDGFINWKKKSFAVWQDARDSFYWSINVNHEVPLRELMHTILQETVSAVNVTRTEKESMPYGSRIFIPPPNFKGRQSPGDIIGMSGQI